MRMIEHATTPVSAAAQTLPAATKLGVTQLIVTDLDRSTRYYEDVIGLTRIGEPEGGFQRLGTPDGAVVVELREQPDAQRAGRHAGLYHLALLYPSREELAQTIHRIADSGSPIEGASDHGTHEAIYLPDPDGNGLELAVDRPRAQWPNVADIEEIRPRALDIGNLLETVVGTATPPRAANGLQTGHLHLHVGDIPRARDFYTDVIGFELQTSLGVAAFVSAGGYHHHLGFNTWRGVGVGPAPKDAVGLGYWTVELPSAADVDALEQRLTSAGAPVSRRMDGTLVTQDEWRNVLHVIVAAS